MEFNMKKNMHFCGTGKPTYVSRQQGASLLEGIAYLGIAAIVVLGAVSLLTSAFSGAQTNRAIEEVISIRTAVKKLYMGQSSGYGTGSLNANLITAKVLPTSLPSNSGTGAITNAWNGAVTITGANANFTIDYANVPPEVCVNMLVASSGWESVDTGASAPILAANFPITPAAAATACGNAATNVTWTAN